MESNDVRSGRYFWRGILRYLGGSGGMDSGFSFGYVQMILLG